MKNILSQIKNILIKIKYKLIIIKIDIKRIIANIIIFIILVLIKLISFPIMLLIEIIAIIALSIRKIRTIKINDLYLIIINKINNIKNSLTIAIKDICNKIKNRFNKDCFGKRLFKNLKNIIHFKFTRDILPFLSLITAKLYLFFIIYLSLLDLII